MSLLRKIEEKEFIGPIIKDYGIISDSDSLGYGTRKISVLLTEKSGCHRFIIRFVRRSLLSENVSYIELDLTAAYKLSSALEDALKQMKR